VPEEQKAIDQAQAKLKRRLRDPDEEASWIRWTGNTRLVRECREGDTMIQIWRSAGAKRPSAVFRMAPVLLKQRTKRWTRFYLDDPVGSDAELTWGRFKRLLKDSGYVGQPKPGMTRLLEPGIAAAVARQWRSAARASKK
jgi:hypothetical protein